MIDVLKQLLVAEDDPNGYNNFVTAVYSLSKNINVMRVDDGYSLLTMLQTNIKPQAIFLDINLKFKNGLMTLLEIKEKTHLKDVPVIMLSSYDYPTNIDQAFEYGATFFIQKPSSSLKLAKALTKVFTSSYFSACTQPPKDKFFVR